MPEPRTIVVRPTLLASEMGLWCPVCALPSGLCWTIAIEVDRVPNRVFTFARCVDCGGDRVG